MSEDLRKKKNDYLLELALEESLKTNPDMLKYREENVPEHEFSERHNKQMKRLFKMAERVERKAAKRRRAYQAAAGIAVFLCFGTFAVTQVEAVRIPVVQFLIEVKEKYTATGSQKENSLNLSEKFVGHEPTYVPKGYVVVDVKESKSGFQVKYEAAEGDSWYRFYYFSNMASANFDSEEGVVSEININGNSALLIQKSDEIRISINTGTERFYLNGVLPYEEAVKIMESIKF